MPTPKHYKVAVSEDRDVFFTALKPSDLLRCQTINPATEEDSTTTATNKLTISGLQISIYQVGDEKIGFEELRKRWDDLFTFQDQMTLIHAFNGVNYPAEKPKAVLVPAST